MLLWNHSELDKCYYELFFFRKMADNIISQNTHLSSWITKYKKYNLTHKQACKITDNREKPSLMVQFITYFRDFSFEPHKQLAVFHLNCHTTTCFLIHSSSSFISRHKINHTRDQLRLQYGVEKQIISHLIITTHPVR